jgi:hypothetical protein
MKRLLLKVLHDIEQPGGPLRGCSSQDQAIIGDWLPQKVLHIDRLEDQEIIHANQAFEELRRSGLIAQSPRTTTRNVYILTEAGRVEAQKSIDQMKLLTILIEDILTRSDLLDKVRGDYYNGDYDSATCRRRLQGRTRRSSNNRARLARSRSRTGEPSLALVVDGE